MAGVFESCGDVGPKLYIKIHLGYVLMEEKEMSPQIKTGTSEIFPTYFFFFFLQEND